MPASGDDGAGLGRGAQQEAAAHRDEEPADQAQHRHHVEPVAGRGRGTVGRRRPTQPVAPRLPGRRRLRASSSAWTRPLERRDDGQ